MKKSMRIFILYFIGLTLVVYGLGVSDLYYMVIFLMTSQATFYFPLNISCYFLGLLVVYHNHSQSVFYCFKSSCLVSIQNIYFSQANNEIFKINIINKCIALLRTAG